MPTDDGRFRGQGWSQHKEDAWTRIFGPALADDPAYEEDAGPATQQLGNPPFQVHDTCVHWETCAELGCVLPSLCVPSEPARETRTCPAGHGECLCYPGSTSEAYCYAERSPEVQRGSYRYPHPDERR